MIPETRKAYWKERSVIRREDDVMDERYACYNTIQYNIRLLEAVRTQRRTIIEREKYVENENVKMVHNE